MSDPDQPDTPASTPAPAAAPAETPAQRRRRLDAVFGDVLPETTRDDRDDDSRGRAEGEDPGEAWLKSQVPPHHG